MFHPWGYAFLEAGFRWHMMYSLWFRLLMHKELKVETASVES